MAFNNWPLSHYDDNSWNSIFSFTTSPPLSPLDNVFMQKRSLERHMLAPSPLTYRNKTVRSELLSNDAASYHMLCTPSDVRSVYVDD